MEPSDDLHDLFPGTGAVMKAWGRFQRRMAMTAAKDEGTDGYDRHMREAHGGSEAADA